MNNCFHVQRLTILSKEKLSESCIKSKIIFKINFNNFLLRTLSLIHIFLLKELTYKHWHAKTLMCVLVKIILISEKHESNFK